MSGYIDLYENDAVSFMKTIQYIGKYSLVNNENSNDIGELDKEY